MIHPSGHTIMILALLAFFAAPQDAYRQPPPEVVKLVAADPAPAVSISPDGEWMLMMERDAMPSIEEVGRPLLRLAGIRIDPVSNSRFRTSHSKGLLLRPTRTSDETRIELPEGGLLASVTWSFNSLHFAYTVATDTGTSLYLAAVYDPGAPVLLTSRLNSILTRPTWLPSAESIAFVEVLEDRGPAPVASARPTGPNVRSTSGATSPLRTYQDLLTSQHDEALFEYYATGQMKIGDPSGARAVGEPGLLMALEPSPDGEHMLVSALQRPFSYVMPYWRFPHTIEVWDSSGSVVQTVASIPLGDGIPIDGVRTGPRNVGWTTWGELAWVEALDGGDPKVAVEHRDRWMRSNIATGEDNEIARVEYRARGIQWIENYPFVVLGEYDRDRRWTRSMLHSLRDPDIEPIVLDDRSVRNRYDDPGRFVTKFDGRGSSVIAILNGEVWRTGAGASPSGSRPFLDQLSLTTFESKRLWHCEEGVFETVVHVSPNFVPDWITRRESPTEPPNYFAHSSGESKRLTDFPDPTPELREIRKELVTYERADGVPLSATLYLPADYEEGTRLPLFVWAYPIEFTDRSTAGQVTATPTRFTRVRGPSHLALVTQGYAVLDGATMPIIGDPETMNDTFVEQIVAASQAAIDYCHERGVADRERVAVGGHSYGAFMTANLLAHCDLFKAGIARSGAYNRTLTPFGFQSERRTIWEATDAYIHVSPFFVADKINEPLLLIHGEVDNNSGTYPMQSQRLFAGLQGNGGTARLVMLPHESHGYRAEESVLHTLAEMIDWLDLHVKAAPEAEDS